MIMKLNLKTVAMAVVSCFALGAGYGAGTED